MRDRMLVATGIVIGMLLAGGAAGALVHRRDINRHLGFKRTLRQIRHLPEARVKSPGKR